MRRLPSGTFERISDPETLWRAWQSYQRGKRRRPAVARFALEADRHLFRLSRELRQGRYRPGAYHLSLVRDPKLRLIAAPSMRDRVLHQALVEVVGQAWSRSFVAQSYACRPDRGTHRAVLVALGAMRRLRHRLHLDIHRYFASVHHGTLLQLLHRPLRDTTTQDLLTVLVRRGGQVYQAPLARRVPSLNDPPVPTGHGIPVGSLLSQQSANLYLDGLDHHVLRALRVGAYLRYMDDLVLFDDDRGRLHNHLGEIEAWLAEHRRLQLNPKHREVVPNTEPFTWLGYRVSRAGLAPGPKMRRRFERNLRRAEARGHTALERCIASYRSVMQLG